MKYFLHQIMCVCVSIFRIDMIIKVWIKIMKQQELYTLSKAMYFFIDIRGLSY